LDDDGDLDIPWQNLRGLNQGVQWFNAKKQLLGQSGKLTPNTSLQVGTQSLNPRHIRSLTISVYSYYNGKKRLEGYIRVNESSEALENLLGNLRLGLGLGGIFALILSGIGSQWLTRQSLKPVEQSFQQLKQFTADASHELRSPLTAIKTSVEVMRMHPDRIYSSDLKKLDRIADATNQMIRLVEDLLLLARIDVIPSNKLREWVSIPLDKLLEDLLDTFEFLAQQRGITINFDVYPHIYVLGNSSQLRRLFSNLLHNALQYTPAGGTVTLTLFPIDNWVIISVEDTGMGIDSQDLPHIFDRFWRADRARTCCEGGAGLGLAIAQSIVHSHGGEIAVNSTLDYGTCFQIRLPYKILENRDSLTD
ncbi:MAG TPA: HAMP domain-containing sensor histidine kinase, partial [Cyanophyceae cyanobacterium]